MSSKRGRPRKKITLEDLPEKCRNPVIKHMADNQLDSVEDALASIVKTIDGTGKEINRLADLKYKKRHFAEMNKAIATRVKQAETVGYATGHLEAETKFKITYKCKKCNKEIAIFPNSGEHQAIVNHLYLQGWVHKECPP
jgi:hypothetical protein